MRTYSIVILLIFLSGIFASRDDYLKTSSNSTFTEETTFGNFDFAQKAVYGIYSSFMHQDLHANMQLFYKSGSDIEFVIGASDNVRRDLAQYTANDGNTQIAGPWNRYYQAIERANLCIDNLPESPIWEGEFAREARSLYAEAVVLRAFCYYEIVSYWGDVPFPIKSTQAGDDFYLPKTDRDEIFEYLVQDLKDVEEYLSWMSSSAERVTRGFCKGLRARIALAYAGYSLRNKASGFETRRGRYWQEYYKIANEECRELMASERHSLNPSFESIFRIIHAYSQDTQHKEVLWEIPFGRGKSGRIAQMIGMRFSTSPAEPKYGRAAAEIGVPISYFYSFNTKDTRRNVSVELYDYANSSDRLSMQSLVGVNNFKPCKWRRTWLSPAMGGDLASNQAPGINWPIMRYADVLLMFAETENELNNGPTAEAKQAFAQIRMRAFPQEEWDEQVNRYIDSVSGSKETFFRAIVDERAWEFGGELVRKFDLVRWNLLGEKLEKMLSDVNKIIHNDPEFSHIPHTIYWRTLEDNETIHILNPDFNYEGEVPEGYTANRWLTDLSESNITSIESAMNQVVAGFDKNKNNHLFPLSMSTITASNYVLENDLIP
ncbi:MAG: RagB/SusD family nutrient uptake outer membrane protein [Bacteroides sp.]|nr:RagB/SusD family nutrient uptake outer membrane protein [Bacteroides sp.]